MGSNPSAKQLQKNEAAIHGPFNGACLCPQFMTGIKPFVAATALLSMLAVPAEAQKGRRVEQDAAYQQTREGNVRPLRAIENALVPQMKARGADYIGAEFDGDEARYRLKFMRGSSVIWIDVDGKSGNVVGRAGE
jgi:hypothetical protein